MCRFGLTPNGEKHLEWVFPALTMHEVLPSTLASVGTARRIVTRFAAELEVDLDGLALAVSEAMANAIAHGYPGDAAGTIDLSAEASPFEVTVTVRDHGCGLADGESPPGAGFGLMIIRRARPARRADRHDRRRLAHDGVPPRRNLG